MNITIDSLSNAPLEISEYFLQHYDIQTYPNGIDSIELFLNKNTPLNFLHYLYNSMTELDGIERALYIQRADIHNSQNFKTSEQIYNSRKVKNSKMIQNSKCCFNSHFIQGGAFIYNSKCIKYSNNILNSCVIASSLRIINSYKIKFSTDIIKSAIITNSESIFHSTLVKNSMYIYNSHLVKNSYFGKNLIKCNHCLFCNNLYNKKYYLFNKPCSPKRYNEVKSLLLEWIDNKPFTFVRIDKKTVIPEKRFIYADAPIDLFDSFDCTFIGQVGTLKELDIDVLLKIFIGDEK